jgi:hypothetical protein
LDGYPVKEGSEISFEEGMLTALPSIGQSFLMLTFHQFLKNLHSAR